MDKLKIENGKLKDEDKKNIYIKFVRNFQLSTFNFQLSEAPLAQISSAHNVRILKKRGYI